MVVVVVIVVVVVVVVVEEVVGGAPNHLSLTLFENTSIYPVFTILSCRRSPIPTTAVQGVGGVWGASGMMTHLRHSYFARYLQYFRDVVAQSQR